MKKIFCLCLSLFLFEIVFADVPFIEIMNVSPGKSVQELSLKTGIKEMRIVNINSASGNSYRKVTFDENGRQLSYQVLSKENKVLETYRFHYDENKCIKREHSAEGIKEETLFNYDEKGHLLNAVTYFKDGTSLTEDYCGDNALYTFYESGSIKEKIIREKDNPSIVIKNTYSEEGLLVREECRTDGERTWSKIYSYREDGSINLYKELDDRNNLVLKTIYEYDEESRLITEKIHDENMKMIKRYAYIYEDGNCVRYTVYDKHNAMTERTCYKYDEKGMVVFAETFDCHGLILSRITQEYDEKGNLTLQKKFVPVEETDSFEVADLTRCTYNYYKKDCQIEIQLASN